MICRCCRHPADWWLYADPLISVLIGFLVLGSSWKLLKESTNILLEQAPRGPRRHRGRREVDGGVGGVEGGTRPVCEITSAPCARCPRPSGAGRRPPRAAPNELEAVLTRVRIGATTWKQIAWVTTLPRIAYTQFLPRIEKRSPFVNACASRPH